MSSVGELQDKEVISTIVDSSSLEEKENNERCNNIVMSTISKSEVQVTENPIENSLDNNVPGIVSVDSVTLESTAEIIEEYKEQKIILEKEHPKEIIESTYVDDIKQEKNEEQTPIITEEVIKELAEPNIERENINNEVKREVKDNITSGIHELEVEDKAMVDIQTSILEEDELRKKENLDFKGFPVGIIPEKAEYLLTDDRHQYLSLSTICRIERDTKRIFSVGVLLSDKGDTQIPKHKNLYRLLKICNLKGTAFFLYIQKPVDLKIGR